MWGESRQIDPQVEIDIGLGEVIKFSVKLDGILRPDRRKKLQKLIRHRTAFLHFCAGGVHFVFGPANAKAHAKTSIREIVESRQPASSRDWAVIGNVEYAGPEEDFLGLRREI
jgi:hypothetical protein